MQRLGAWLNRTTTPVYLYPRQSQPLSVFRHVALMLAWREPRSVEVGVQQTTGQAVHQTTNNVCGLCAVQLWGRGGAGHSQWLATTG